MRHPLLPVLLAIPTTPATIYCLYRYAVEALAPHPSDPTPRD
jgi:hypothetical protein